MSLPGQAEILSADLQIKFAFLAEHLSPLNAFRFPSLLGGDGDRGQG